MKINTIITFQLKCPSMLFPQEHFSAYALFITQLFKFNLHAHTVYSLLPRRKRGNEGYEKFVCGVVCQRFVRLDA